ncbi:TonB-dependent siderophore receptor [Aliarcobacter vitoriensis]|uniref:TonB-dependent siderophore receptor n=1 Tax=Aliarcobacter vitoriensis TaxID=2011099 RepID=UPI0022873AA6|nr:TonB-dependent siderophore receptor [Aliarcobacter vitoriensis]
MGPWKGKSLQDTPVSINVITEDLIQNIQATSVDSIYKINPVVHSVTNQGREWWNPINLRGFSINTAAFDGMKREKWQYFENANSEEFERIETITGLTGFLYGGDSVGGIMNYIPKRPTSKAQHSVTLGNAGGKSGYYTHIDLGGPLTEDGKLGYRLNVVSQDNDTHIEHQSIERQMINLALDYKPTDNLLLQATVSDSKYRMDGMPMSWNLSSGVKRPSAKTIDANKLWGEKWTFNDRETRRYSTNLLWNINDNINFRAAYMNETLTRKGVQSSGRISSDGTYSKYTDNSEWLQDRDGYGVNAFFDFDFDTVGVEHQLTLGMQKGESKTSGNRYGYSSAANVTVTGLSFNNPTYHSEPMKDSITSTFKNEQYLKSTNYIIGDSISFSPEWDLLVGANYVEFEYKDDNYKKSKLTPSASLVYKPIENLTLYTTYMEALEMGGIAGDTYGGYAVINANEMMEPVKSDQIEVGAKLTLGNTLLTATYFEIDKAFEFYDNDDITKPKYVQDGRQVHKGFEVTATGKITDNLTALGGFTILDAKVKENKNNPALEGKRPSNVADNFVKLYLEYTPFDTIDFAVNGGANYTGSFYGNNLNTDKIDSYTLVNLGARYTTNATTYPLTFRLNVNNAFDKEYWVSSNYLGDRRTIHASVQMKF